GHGREALIRREPIDPIAVLFPEEQTARPGIDRETSEHGLTGSLGKRDDDPRGEGAVDGLGGRRIEPEDLRGGIAPPAVAQDDERSGGGKRELRRSGYPHRHDFDAQPGRQPNTRGPQRDRKSTRLNSSHQIISYAV